MHSRTLNVMSLAQRHSPCTSKVSRQCCGKDDGSERPAMKLDPPSRGVASRQAVLELNQSRGTSGRRTTQGHADPLHRLVAASRLNLDHVVTRRRLCQLKAPCVTFRSLSSWAIVSNRNSGEGSRFHRRTWQANASSHKCRSAPAESTG